MHRYKCLKALGAPACLCSCQAKQTLKPFPRMWYIQMSFVSHPCSVLDIPQVRVCSGMNRSILARWRERRNLHGLALGRRRYGFDSSTMKSLLIPSSLRSVILRVSV